MATTITQAGGWRTGLRTGAGLAAGTFLLAVSFGAFAVTHGWPAALTIAMSLLVFSGSAQFALVTAFAGGGLITALASASLINLRYVPMAAMTARHLHGGHWRRAVEGQAVVDGSWVAAQRPDGGFDRAVLIAATLVQWPAWVCGTAIGALAVPSTSVIHTAGLDLVFPGFFAVLLATRSLPGPGCCPSPSRPQSPLALPAGSCRTAWPCCSQLRPCSSLSPGRRSPDDLHGDRRNRPRRR